MMLFSYPGNRVHGHSAVLKGQQSRANVMNVCAVVHSGAPRQHGARRLPHEPLDEVEIVTGSVKYPEIPSGI